MKKTTFFRGLASMALMCATAFGMNAAEITWQDMELDTQYTIPDGTIVDGLWMPSTTLKWTAPSNGKLTITQTGDDMSGLFTSYTLGATGSNNWQTRVNSDNDVAGSGSTYVLEYTIAQGMTYYFVAPAEELGAKMKTAKMSFVSSGVVEVGKITENVPFTAYQEVMEYVPEVDGVLSVSLNRQDIFGLVGSEYSFLYIDAGHKYYVPSIDPVGKAGENGSWVWQFYVNAGTPYYFYQNWSNGEATGRNLEFTFSTAEMTEAPKAAITETMPTAGGAGLTDSETYVGGARFIITPATGLTIGSTVMTYTSAVDNSLVTVELPAPTYEGGAWTVYTNNAYNEALLNGKPNSLVNVILRDIEINGNPAETVNETGNSFVICKDSDITIQYLIPGGDLALVHADIPTAVYSSYPEAGQANGIATFTFNYPIKAANATLTLGQHYYGSPSGGDEPDPSYTFNVEDGSMKIEGQTITLDLTQSNLVPAGKTYTQVTLMLLGVTAENGMEYKDNGSPALTEYIPYSNTAAPEAVETLDKGLVMAPADGNNYAIGLDYFVLQYPGLNLSFVDDNVKTVDLYVDGNKVGEAECSIWDSALTGAFDGEEDDEPTVEPVNDILYIDFGAYAGMNTNYMVTIPQGLVQNEEGIVNPTQIVTCTILAANYNYEVTPEENSEENPYEEIEEVVISYGGETLQLNESAGAISLEPGRIMPGSTNLSADGLTIAMGELEDGVYTLTIPATYIVIGGESLNAEIVLTYVIQKNNEDEPGEDNPSGIESLLDSDGVMRVYNLNGVLVGNDLNSIQSGIYVINGKKVIVRK